MSDERRPDEASAARQLPSELLARFRAEHPDADLAQLDAWMVANEAALGDRHLSVLVNDVLARLEETYEDASGLFVPPGEGDEVRPTPSTFTVGDRIGRFILREFLAAGGMGQVWRARDDVLDRDVALKLLLPGRVDDRVLGRFAREARAGGRLRHPNLVTTFGFGWDDDLSWIAQELVDGSRTLKDQIEEWREAGRSDPEYFAEVARRVAELADGLHVAHETGVLHRDVKPANILIAPNGRWRLTDFGLARVVDETALSVSGEVAGTWAYMSPEQVRARHGTIDRRVDVFALGVILYELFALRRPFAGDSVEQTASQILMLDPPEPSVLRPSCPAELSSICGKALEKVPSQRYATTAALAEDLRRFLADEDVLARPPSRLQRARRWARRRPALATAAACGLLALIVVSGLLVRRASDARALERLAFERERQAAEAAAERDALLDLSADARLDELIERQRELWPPLPERIADLRAWIADASRMVDELPLRRSRLREFGSTAAFATSADRLASIITRIEQLESGLAAEDGIDPAEGWSVPMRLRFALEQEQGLAPGGTADLAWRAVLPALRADFPQLPDEAWPGVLPLGRDPDSGLWEFAHLASGAAPTRGADGALAIDADSSIVLVLIPGGTFTMGAQVDDPDAPNYDPASMGWGTRPVRDTTVSPFLIGKHELTQGQWLRLTGSNPSRHRAGDVGDDGVERTLLHPVESISWVEADRNLRRFDLALPTEAQWERAARAGSATNFSFGRDEDAPGRVNVSDTTARDAGAVFPTSPTTALHSDGWVYHAPVGTFPPNAFGLHEVHGNLFEFVADAARYDDYRDDELGSDPVVTTGGNGHRMTRGGSFGHPPEAARSNLRWGLSETATGARFGIRAARALPPAR